MYVYSDVLEKQVRSFSLIISHTKLQIERKGAGKYTVYGKIERTDDETLLITELPIKKWTQDYKVMLESMMTGDDKKPAEITDFKENHTETT